MSAYMDNKGVICLGKIKLSFARPLPITFHIMECLRERKLYLKLMLSKERKKFVLLYSIRICVTYLTNEQQELCCICLLSSKYEHVETLLTSLKYNSTSLRRFKSPLISFRHCSNLNFKTRLITRFNLQLTLFICGKGLRIPQRTKK